MSGSAWFPCYTNDLLGSMRWKCMSPAQRGAYWQLICWQMQADDGTLPDDIPTLSILADLDLTDGNGCIVDSFPPIGSGRRANRRALKEWGKRKALSKIRSEVGNKGVAARKQLQSKRQAIGQPIAATSTSTSTTRPTTKGEKPLSQIIESFEKAWNAYGKYGVKAKSLDYWKALKPEDRIQVENAIPAYMQCVAAGRAKSQFEGWINPRNRKWDMDWGSVVKAMGGETPRTKETDPSILNYAEEYKRMKKEDAPSKDWQRLFSTIRDNCGKDGIKRVKEAAR